MRSFRMTQARHVIAVAWLTAFFEVGIFAPLPSTSRAGAVPPAEPRDDVLFRGRTVKELIEDLRSPDPDERRDVLMALGELGPEAREAVPAVIALLKDPTQLPAPVMVLGRIGPAAREAVPLLAQALTKYEKSFPRDEAVALVRIDPAQAPRVVAETLKALDSPDQDLALSADGTLRGLGPSVATALPELLRRLKGRHDFRERQVIQAVGGLGEAGPPAVSRLREIVRDPTPEPARRDDPLGPSPEACRIAAIEALGQIGPAAKEAVPDLLPLFRSPDKVRSRAAAVALVRIDRDHAREAWDSLRAALRDPNDFNRRQAVATMARVGPAASDGVPNLLATQRMPTKEGGRKIARYGVVLVIEAIGPAAVPGLLDGLKDADPHVRFVAASSLFPIKSPQAARALSACLADPDRDVRAEAAKALAAIGPQAAPALIDAFRSPDAAVRQQAAVVLGMMNRPAFAAVPALVERLKDERADVRSTTALALGMMRRGAREAIPALRELLKGRQDAFDAAIALAMIDPTNSTDVVPTLVTGLSRQPLARHLVTAPALACLGPAAREALPELRTVLKQAERQKDRDVAQAVRRAIRLIDRQP
jgi:HEAT repeat protein